MKRVATLTFLLAMLGSTMVEAASPFVFSYGGRLTNGDEAVKGPVDIGIKFWRHATSTSAALQIPISPITKSGVVLEDGVFQVDITNLLPSELNLVFSSTERTWIEITDKTNGRIYPRQMVTTVPYALKVPVDGKTVSFNTDGALSMLPGTVAGAGQFLTTDAAGALKWESPPTPASALSGVAVSSTPPTNGQVLTYNNTASKWEATTLTGGGNMNTTTYDSNANGKVDLAEDAEKLGGTAASSYVTTSALPSLISSNLPAGVSQFGADVGTAELANDAVTTVKIIDDAITSAKIADGTIVGNDISASAAIGDSKLATITTAGKVNGGAITSGTIAGTTALNTSGNVNAAAITASGVVSGNGVSSSSYLMTGNAGTVKLKDADGSNYVALQAPTNVTTNHTFVLPDSGGLSGYVLTTDGASPSILSWAPPTLSVGTPIDGITNGVLFQGPGNTLQTSNNLAWEAGPARLTVVGKVNITQGLKLVSQPAPPVVCDSSGAGTLAVNSTAGNVLCYCNGSAWTAVVGGSCTGW